MSALKVIALSALAYVGMIALFESSLGLFQPTDASTLVITTTDENGVAHDRVLARLGSEGRLYVAANHWPRRWYRRALQNPNVRVTDGGIERAYLAVRVTGEEHDRVDRDNGLGIAFRILTGFPPRYFLRLDPR